MRQPADQAPLDYATVAAENDNDHTNVIQENTDIGDQHKSCFRLCACKIKWICFFMGLSPLPLFLWAIFSKPAHHRHFSHQSLYATSMHQWWIHCHHWTRKECLDWQSYMFWNWPSYEQSLLEDRPRTEKAGSKVGSLIVKVGNIETKNPTHLFRNHWDELRQRQRLLLQLVYDKIPDKTLRSAWEEMRRLIRCSGWYENRWSLGQPPPMSPALPPPDATT